MFIVVSGQSNGTREGLAVARAAEHAAAANSSGEQWSWLQQRATSANMEHATMAGYTGARCAMKADFDCGILL